MAKKSKKASKDIFQRFKDTIVDFFREEPVTKPIKPKIRRKKPAVKKKPRTPAKKVFKKGQRRIPPKKPKLKPEEVPMPAPWSKVIKYKKIKPNNYYF